MLRTINGRKTFATMMKAASRGSERIGGRIAGVNVISEHLEVAPHGTVGPEG